MKSVTKMTLMALNLCVLSVFFSWAEDPVCHHCEEIREYNAAHHENYEYYDQYLKSHPNPETNGKDAPVAERDDNIKNDSKKVVPINSDPTSVDRSGVKTVQSPTTDMPQTSISAPEAAPVDQAPQN